jgi:hypothetical protein
MTYHLLSVIVATNRYSTMLIGAASLSARPPAFSIILANTTNQKSWLSPWSSRKCPICGI